MMLNWRDNLFILMFAITIMTAFNAQEAHRHSHDAACYAGAEHLCKYVSKEANP